jgi:signal transduction histidine kinase/CheY-like chemotaxis protein
MTSATDTGMSSRSAGTSPVYARGAPPRSAARHSLASLASLDDAVRAEHVRALHDHLPIVLGANVVVATILVGLYWGELSSAALCAWWAAMIAQCAVRMWLRTRYLRAKPLPHQLAPWVRALAAGSFVAGVVWGVAGWLLFDGSLERQLAICFVLGGMAAGATASLAGVPAAYWLYLIPSMLPLTVTLLTAGEGRTMAMGLMTIVFTSGLAMIAANLYRHVSRAHAYRFRNEWLAGELAMARKELTDANGSLEARVVQRTAELERAQQVQRETERELRHAQRMEALGQLTRGVAHDFNNLLTIVTSSLDLIAARYRGAADVSALVGHALAATARGAELTRSLIAFSRTQQLRPLTLDANTLVRRMVDDLLGRALGAQVRIETKLAADLWPVRLDPLQLETALLNLAINARDAMLGGGVLTIVTRNVAASAAESRGHGEAVDCGAEAPAEGWIEVRVRDTGGGIPTHLQHRVFEPFFSTKAAGRGSGLGLSMVYGFVRQSGGAVRLTSSEGDGCEIALSFPRSRGQVQLQHVEPRRAPSLPRVPQGERILIVEDDPQVLELTVRMVEMLGYRTVHARDAESALACIRGEGDIHVLLSDVVMPGGTDGGKLAELAVSCRPTLRVLLVSGYTDTASTAQSGVAWPLLHKPFTAAQLEVALHAALYQSPNADPVPAE